MDKLLENEVNDEKHARRSRGHKLSQQWKDSVFRFQNVNTQGGKSRNSCESTCSSVGYATQSAGPSGIAPKFRFHKVVVG